MLLLLTFRSRAGAAGEALNTYDFFLPESAKTLVYTYVVQGTNAPLVNRMKVLYNNSLGTPVVTDAIVQNVFDDTAALARGGGQLALVYGTHLRLETQSAALTANDFIVHIAIHD